MFLLLSNSRKKLLINLDNAVFPIIFFLKKIWYVLDKEVKEDTYHRRERSFGKFQRAFTLPVEVDPGTINAEYKDGVLTVNVPKPEGQKPRQITIH